MTLNVFSISVCQMIKLRSKFDRNQTIYGKVIDDLAHFRRRYVTLMLRRHCTLRSPDVVPLIPWLWTFVVDRYVSRVQTLCTVWYEIWAKLSNCIVFKGRRADLKTTCQRVWTELHQEQGRTALSSLHEMRYFVSDPLIGFKTRAAQRQVVSKIEAKFCHFLPL